jgi:hypothetical protein
LKPDHLGASEERERLERFPELGETAESFVGVGGGGVDDLIIEALALGAPLLENLARALFDTEFIVPMDQDQGWG